MQPDTSTIILAELRELQKAVNENIRVTGERLAALETSMYALTGNGQPGRMTKAEDAIQDLRLEVTRRIWWCLGAAAGVSGVVTCVAWFIKH